MGKPWRGMNQQSIDAMVFNQGLLNGINFMFRLDMFRAGLRVGDVFVARVEDCTMQPDGHFQHGLRFTVRELYKHCVLMDRRTVSGTVHREAFSYVKLFTRCRKAEA